MSYKLHHLQEILSEEQLQKFKEAFYMFDRSNNNSLEDYEFNACLTFLGENVTGEKCKQIIAEYAPGQKRLDFDNYIRYMTDRFAKTKTIDPATEEFFALALSLPIINDEQLNKYFKPEDVECLKTQLKPVDGGYDFASWVELNLNHKSEEEENELKSQISSLKNEHQTQQNEYESQKRNLEEKLQKLQKDFEEKMQKQQKDFEEKLQKQQKDFEEKMQNQQKMFESLSNQMDQIKLMFGPMMMNQAELAKQNDDVAVKANNENEKK